YGPMCLFMWPKAGVPVVGGEQAASVLATVKVEQLKARGQKLSDAEIDAIRQPILAKYETEGSPYYTTARLWYDGVITPGQTRRVLGLALAACLEAPVADTA